MGNVSDQYYIDLVPGKKCIAIRTRHILIWKGRESDGSYIQGRPTNAIENTLIDQIAQLRADVQAARQERERLDLARDALAITAFDQQQRIAALETAAIILIGKINRIHESDEYRAVWECAQNHFGPYRGESYEDELSSLAKLLATHAPAADAEPRAED